VAAVAWRTGSCRLGGADRRVRLCHLLQRDRRGRRDRRRRADQFNAARGLPERTAEVDRLFSLGTELGWIGVWCFLVAGAATALAVVMRVGRRALPGAVVLLVAAVLFTGGWHIYWPAGVVTMLVLAVGLGLLAVALPDPQPPGRRGLDTAARRAP
jgi:hypothetical protein